jgi:hypothetical protein
LIIGGSEGNLKICLVDLLENPFTSPINTIDFGGFSSPLKLITKYRSFGKILANWLGIPAKLYLFGGTLIVSI